MTPNMVVASNVRRLRKLQGWTQAELGNRLGWHSTVVCHAERAAERARRPGRRFSIDDVALLAGVLGVTIADLLVLPPPCPCCGDRPPAGLACKTCGAG